jgi:prophage antirepressor-like protein
MVNDEPWFKGLTVAESLGYDRPSKAIYDHVPEKYKTTYKNLMRVSISTESVHMEGSEANTLFITEAGLYRLIFKSRQKEAQVFCDWVCSEVLPSIRKTGSFSMKSKWDIQVNGFNDVKLLAKGETKLHYQIITHIRNKYPDIITIAGLGEYQEYDYQRMDAYLKGYNGGQPDITLLKKLKNGFTDVVAIELKNPNGYNITSVKQDEFIKRLHICNVETLVSNNYDDIIIWLHDHYKAVGQKTILSIDNVSYDFSMNCNPKYWLHRLKNKANLINECKKRNIKTAGFTACTNVEIIELLINHDRNHITH